jgi:hypothetical protein
MLHLAQVKKKDLEGKVMLQLLAQQKTEYAWTLLPDETGTLWIEGSDCLDQKDYPEGSLVLVQLTPTRQVEQMQDATDWVLGFIEQYLATGVTPTLLQEEVQRAEQWRQSLTLQSQELGRRSLEIEARRDQIQELEENLKLEKKKLESMAHQLKEEKNGAQPSEQPIQEP